MQGAQVRSLIKELRSHMLCNVAKMLKKENQPTNQLAFGPLGLSLSFSLGRDKGTEIYFVIMRGKNP